MKKYLLFLTLLLCTGLMKAQNGRMPAEVTPGSKGTLPELTPLAPAREGEVPILDLFHVGYTSDAWSGAVYLAANLSFPMVSEVGCDYYTLQYRKHGATGWATRMSGDEPYLYEDRTVGAVLDISVETDYRLVLHGGEKDGYVSNIVTAKLPCMYSRYSGWQESPTIEHTMLGIPVGEQFNVTAQTYSDGKTTDYSTAENLEYFTYQWYRRNPNNWDMEEIDGATERIYTPTLEDLGYQLVIKVSGDREHCDFTLVHPLSGVVCVPVQASIDYIGADGFVLNTDYVIPNLQEMLTRTEYSWMEGAPAFNPSCISERAPGQYVFRLPRDDYNYREFTLTDPAYFLTFYYEMMGWYREVQIMSDVYQGGLGIKAEMAGQPVHTTIDIIGQNIDGEWVTVTSGELTEEGNDILYFGEGIYRRPYYLRANATDGTQTTYYPSALTLSDAETVMPGEMWAAPEFTIEVQGKGDPGSDPNEGEDVWLVLWQKSGEVATYHVNTHPRIKHQDGNFLIISDEVEIAYPVDDVRKFTLAKDISSFEDGIIGVPEDDQPRYALDKARPGSFVNIYDMSGRKVGSHIVGDNGNLRYSLDDQPAGMYLIKTETTTIKIIKK